MKRWFCDWALARKSRISDFVEPHKVMSDLIAKAPRLESLLTFGAEIAMNRFLQDPQRLRPEQRHTVTRRLYVHHSTSARSSAATIK